MHVQQSLSDRGLANFQPERSRKHDDLHRELWGAYVKGGEKGRNRL